jgi:hypothetical protein
MSFNDSAIFRQHLADLVGFPAVAAGNWNGAAGAYKVALFGTFGDPVAPPEHDKNVSAAESVYGTGAEWLLADEIIDTGPDAPNGWPAGGLALTGTALDTTTPDEIVFDAADLPGDDVLTLLAVYGNLLYWVGVPASAPPSRGLAFHSYGGSQGVTAGTFTIIWNTAGIMRIDME